MKIIKQGKMWWENKEITCPHCETVMVMDKKDKPFPGSDAGNVIGCPICGTYIPVPGGPNPSQQ